MMVHAGVLPSWTAAHAQMLSGEVEAKLASDDAHRFLGVLYGDEPSTWRDDLDGDDRLRAIVNVCTRLRFCTADGRIDFREKRGRDHAPPDMRRGSCTRRGARRARRSCAGTGRRSSSRSSPTC
jgi:bis(5'-nucleosyl)-tetraphosphatase (symmetrical)